METLLHVHAASKRYGGVAAVDDVSFSVPKGTICGLVGPNGAGKTTLIDLISGYVPLSFGEVRLRDRRLSGRAPHAVARSGVVRTFQHARIFESMTVLDSLIVAGHLQEGAHRFATACGLARSAKSAGVRSYATDVLEQLRLTDWAHVDTHALPFGLRKRLGNALALMANPELLLLDEPAAGLNTAETEELTQDIATMREQGKTIVLVEHNMPLIMELSDKVVVLDHGAKIAEGTPSEVSSDARVIEAYLGG